MSKKRSTETNHEPQPETVMSNTAEQARLKAMMALANEAAEQAETDMSESSTGGGARKLYPEGYAFARLVEYIEFGKHADEYQGVVKQPALTFRLGFAIWGKPPGQEATFHNEDGTPGIIRSFDMRLSNNEKAGAKIAFDRLNYKGKAKQFYQFIGQSFLIHVTQKVGKDPSKGPSNRIVLKDTLPPFDPATGTPYQIPEAPAELYKLFIWNKPTKEGWDSLFVDGTRDDGKSKNWLQEKCFEAVDFDGSPLQALLSGAQSVPSPEALAQATLGNASAAPSVAPAPPAAPQAPAVGAVPAAAAPSEAPAAPVVPTPPAPPAVPAVPGA